MNFPPITNTYPWVEVHTMTDPTGQFEVGVKTTWANGQKTTSIAWVRPAKPKRPRLPTLPGEGVIA